MISKIWSKKIAASVIAIVAFAFGSLALVPVYAQVVGATLFGTVTDQSGAVIPNTQISIKNIATGLARAVATDPAGFYAAPNLLPGNYELTATASGFSSEVQTGVTLTVGAQQVLNFTLRVGTVTEKIQVAGEAPTVQLATSSISAVVNSTTVRELPLNGRSWTDLATLQPGVEAIQTQVSFAAGSDRGSRGFGSQIAVAGARPQQNNYRLDGISINDASNGGPGSVLGGNLGVDAIQEFSVLTSNYSAEYGRTSGGVLNAITRSGTNQFHGGVYEFLRNNALDARNFFDAKNPPFRRNQFGADAGGPIRKDKVFVFGDYEGIRQSKGVTTVDTVPSVAARGGTLCSAPDAGPCTGPTPIPGGVDSSAQKYLPFWPLPNGGIKAGTNGDIGIFSFAGQQVVTENFFTTRVDDKLSDKDSLASTYLGDVTPYNSPDSLDAVLINSKTNRQIATLEETHIFSPTLVNSARIGYSRGAQVNALGASAINPLAKDSSLAAIPGQFASQVSVSGLTPFGGGVNGNTHIIFSWNSFQEYDDAFWTHGTHSVKFGGAVERMELNLNQLSNTSGLFSFSTLSDFLTNRPKRFQAGFANTLTARGFRQTLFGLYVQDDWRARPNLTVNLGLRWEMATVPTEVQGKLQSLINLTDPAQHLGSPFFSNPTLRNFEPRVGFAWDPFNNGKTAVRGGFGVFDALPLLYQSGAAIANSSPFFRLGSATHLPPGSFYTGATSLLGSTSSKAAYIEQHPHRNYVMQWNLNLQRELATNLTGMVGYVGSRGVHQVFRSDDLNIVLPTKTPQGYLFPSPVGSGTQLNPNFGIIKGVAFYEGNSSYNALVAGVQKMMSHGVQLQGSFTWGKSIDTGSSSGVGDQFSNSIGSLPWYDLKAIRGLSDFNIGRTLVMSGTWQVPSPKSFSGPAGWIANGWELGAIYKASDGVPFTATFGTDGDPQGLNSSDPWAFPNRLTGPGCNSLVNPGNPNNYIKTQCFAVPTAPSAAFYTANCDPAFGTAPQCFNLRGNSGRNILTGPGTSNLDFSLFKNNHIKRISENFNVQFRAEFFNILNRANLAVPVNPSNTDIFDSTGAPTGVAGLLTSTTTDARQIQFALKLTW
jgi:Carboxypeptidase regulatory-like domain/TonB-dependent Receptor Plug Domain